MSVTVTPVLDILPLAVGLKVILENVPAAGVLAPIAILSIAPPPISTSSITTLPLEPPEICKCEFEALVESVLSLIVIPSTSN